MREEEPTPVRAAVPRAALRTSFVLTFLLLAIPLAALPPGDAPPPSVFDRLDAAGTAADHDGADWVIVLDATENRMVDTGVTYSDREVVTKVLSAKGCRDLSVQRWDYLPLSSDIEIREVNVLRDGATIPVDVALVHDLPAPQSAIYWQDRIKTLQLPRLEVGDGIQVKTFKKGYSYALLEEDDDSRFIPPMRGEYFDIVLFEASVPTLEKRYALILPRMSEETGADRRLHAETYNGPVYSSVRYEDDVVRYEWWALDVPPAVHEPRQPDASDYATKVVMSTAASWEAKSRWFFDVNRNQFEPDDAIRAKVEDIFEDAGVSSGTEAQKAKALVHWVAQNIRYSGQTMGEGEGFTLHPGTMVFEQRHGVCKDIAGMLVTMMRAADMDSYAAMTMAGSRIEDLPADQFNHCVVALKKADGTGWEMYDPTWVPYSHDIWSKLEAEQHYIIGSPEGEDLTAIPYSPPAESRLTVTHDARLLDDGTLEGTFRFEGVGAVDSRLRRMANRELASLDAYFAALLKPVSERLEDVRYTFYDVEDFSRGMWVEVSYRVPGYALPVDGGLEFASPMGRLLPSDAYLFRAAATDWKDERKTDVFLYYTQLIDGTETIRLPKGFAAVDSPASEDVDETYAAFKGWTEKTKPELVIRQHAEVRRRQFPPEGYPGFLAAMKEAKKWGDRTFRVTKGGA